jgi:AraC family transcriptional regulator, positive regulator of tynA and feaB
MRSARSGGGTPQRLSNPKPLPVECACGFVAIDLSCNAHRVERTQRDARVDGVDHFYAVFQVAGRSMMIQNDQAVKLSVGDAALVDSNRPVTYVSESSYGHFALQLPRRSLVSHLGYEPQDGFCGRSETRAGRLLFQQLVLDAVEDEDLSAPADAYMQLAIYDLLGALFAPSGPVPVSLHADKLFRRICGIIKDRFADPEFGPCELAAEAGISLRYVRSSLRRGTLPAVISYTRFVWITPPVSCIAGLH